MFEIKGKYLTSIYYARHIPTISPYIYEMSFVPHSSWFYKTIPFATRFIKLDNDFSRNYTRRLRKYLRQAENLNLHIYRPASIPDIDTMYQPVMEAKNLGPLPPNITQAKEDYFYSEVHHPEYQRLAAHISIGDIPESIVFGLVNVSDFRKFSSPEHQRICSIANKYLFHMDMLYFQQLGFRIYDMVGTREPMNQMKKEFGGDIITTYTHVPRVWYALQLLKRRW